jgi:3-oxoacyl-[acyl-carrier protein] reductase
VPSEPVPAGLHPTRRPVALVTGANHGIGAATAVALARAGARVALTYLEVHDDPDPAQPETHRRNRARDASMVLEAIRSAGADAIAVRADLRDTEAPVALFDRVEAELDPVDVLVNNATGWLADTFTASGTDRLGRRLQPVTAATFEQQFAVDARAGALLIAEFARRHLERQDDWGRIVSLTSGSPLGFPQEVSYGAAKAALENYTMSAALELADHGVTANVVMPPVTDTGWVTDEVRAFVASSSEHVHVASPDEVAEVIGWLCSDAARLVTANRIALR